ncbi:hypothetical protein ACFYUR_22240 [Micromonospora haikouensis]|uniref:hypothetical protein n=1 Tax=Micromonospora haikouensis TaxID=686309 RepID=UPI0036B79C97
MLSLIHGTVATQGEVLAMSMIAEDGRRAPGSAPPRTTTPATPDAGRRPGPHSPNPITLLIAT